MATERIEAPAKINLRLRVLARETSGYHQIETLFASLRLADELVIASGPSGLRLRVEGADVGPAADNLVTRAATAFLGAVGEAPGLDIALHKRIPAGAGLGGGSSDAAATLIALNRLHGRPLESAALLHLAAGLGSDVPFFLAGAPFAMAWGRGERCLRLDPPPDRAVLVGVPAERVSTVEAYGSLDSHTGGPAAAEVLPAAADLRTWAAIARLAANDFERVVLPRVPAAGQLIECFSNAGATVARLSGSGSAVFGIFENVADMERAAELAAARAPTASLIRTATAFR